MPCSTWPGALTSSKAEESSVKARAKSCFRTITFGPPTWVRWREEEPRDSHSTAHPRRPRRRAIRPCSRRPLTNVRGAPRLKRRARRAFDVGGLRNLLALHALADRPVPFSSLRRAGHVRARAAALWGALSIRRASQLGSPHQKLAADRVRTHFDLAHVGHPFLDGRRARGDHELRWRCRKDRCLRSPFYPAGESGVCFCHSDGASLVSCKNALGPGHSSHCRSLGGCGPHGDTGGKDLPGCFCPGDRAGGDRGWFGQRFLFD